MSSPWVLSSLAALTFGSLGCNVIFGIEPGTLGEGASGPSGGSGAGSQGGDPSAGGAGGGVGGGEIGGGGDGGAGGSPPAQECDPTLLEPGETIGANCGLFVDGSTTRGSGTQASPFNHAQAAFTANLPGNIYICGATTFVGHFVLNGGGRVYGGLTCDWQADGELVPELRGDGTVEEAVFISGAIGDDALLDHLFIRGANAAPGGSSFGLKIDRVSTVLRDVSILAGDAGAAVTQAPGSLGSGGVAGTAAASGCNTAVGGAGGSKTCGGTNVSGGNGAACSGAAGNAGLAGMGPGGGNGGIGALCGSGQQGNAGANGAVGGASPPVGFLDAGSYVSAGAPDAPSGSPGGGGGGGGSRPNSNGGGGGSGGCGGDGGRGGQNGGASFALVVISAQVELFDVGMSPGRGGDGSDGTAGLAGGFGGAGSAGNANGCAGASGGVGGRGGPGGAGSGGPSAAVAVFDAMVLVGDTTLLSSAGGDAGMPGMNMSSSGAPIPGPAGSAGLVCAALVFDSGGSDPVCQPTLL